MADRKPIRVLILERQFLTPCARRTADPQVRDLCERQTAIPCYFIDMRPVFDQDGDDLPDPGMINIDGIHPTAESSQLMAEAVWEVMQEQCLASE